MMERNIQYQIPYPYIDSNANLKVEAAVKSANFTWDS